MSSFRDRSARVFYSGDDVFRALTADAYKDWKLVSEVPFFQRRMQQGQIVPTREILPTEALSFSRPELAAAILQHQRVPFISYAYEWPFVMLQQAALLHLELMFEAVNSGLTLKDASPYNIQFHGSQAMLIDIGSFTRLHPGEPWLAYRQFCELILFPLLLQSYRGVDFQPLLRSQLEGISAAQFLQWMRGRDLFRPGVFSHGWLHALLERNAQATSTSTVRDLQSSGFDSKLITKLLQKLQKLVSGLRWVPQRTQWTLYDSSLPHVAEDLRSKSEFVHAICQQQQRTLVWDLGCNDGRYSKIAAEFASTVVAMDHDHACVENLFRSLDARQTTVLPLRVDLANPSPSQGWRGRERTRLEDRGRPDLLLCLGLIHHLVIAANVPLPDVVDWLASFQAELVLEFPSKQDAMVRALLRNKRDQYTDYSVECLEAELCRHFQLEQRVKLPSGERTLYHAIPLKGLDVSSG
ncbi:methyltransferase [Schlesneria sp. T3-172]|uniref:methyltransferase n=1 Tax=Schlesneria sphaerica TaxID=3373610 RepID=UPI0037CA21C3